MLTAVAILIFGFAVLIKGADLFVDGASRLARRLNVSDMAVGLTVVAFGTSAPELFVNLSAAVSGGTDIALGNVVGSNIANILLILGIAALIRPLTVSRGTVWKEIPFALLAGLVLWIVASDIIIDGASFAAVSRIDGLVLLGFFVVFLVYTASIALRVDGLPVVEPVPPDRLGGVALKIAVGFIGLLFGGRWIVDSAMVLAALMAVPPSVVGLTVVAVGTSLPELATSAMAARRGDVEIAVGNVVGSNIFNVFFILGVSALVRPLPLQPAAHVDMGVMTAAGILLFIFMFTGRVRIMDRWEGGMAVCFYLGYIAYLVLSVIFPDGVG